MSNNLIEYFVDYWNFVYLRDDNHIKTKTQIINLNKFKNENKNNSFYRINYNDVDILRNNILFPSL